jgi:hypothetical protein
MNDTNSIKIKINLSDYDYDREAFFSGECFVHSCGYWGRAETTLGVLYFHEMDWDTRPPQVIKVWQATEKLFQAWLGECIKLEGSDPGEWDIETYDVAFQRVLLGEVVYG